MVVNLKTPSDFFERTETLVRYYEDIRKYPLLTIEEENQCFTLLKTGNKTLREKAKTKLVNSNQRFVVAVAKKFANNNNILDLISEGNIGLMEAIEKFDSNKGVRFTTFAVWYIRRAINQYNINNSIVTKTNAAKTYHVISQATNKFVQREHRQPSLEELQNIIVKEYNIDIKEIVDIIDTRFISIDDDSNSSSESTNYGDITTFKTCSASVNSYEKNIDDEFSKNIVSLMLKKLPSRENNIIKMLFGIGYDREYEIQEVAQKMGLSTERVRQLKISTLDKLKSEYAKLKK